jgi:hypothetical protein
VKLVVVYGGGGCLYDAPFCGIRKHRDRFKREPDCIIASSSRVRFGKVLPEKGGTNSTCRWETVSASYGGSISTILFNIPGAPEASATVFDGYSMAQKGQAAEALGYAVMCSCLGGLFSVVVLNLRSPQLARVGLTFSQPEYFAPAVTALTLIASLGGGNMVKAFISAIVGLLLATAGIDEMTADARFTFGTKALLGGSTSSPPSSAPSPSGRSSPRRRREGGSGRGMSQRRFPRNCPASRIS